MEMIRYTIAIPSTIERYEIVKSVLGESVKILNEDEVLEEIEKAGIFLKPFVTQEEIFSEGASAVCHIEIETLLTSDKIMNLLGGMGYRYLEPPKTVIKGYI